MAFAGDTSVDHLVYAVPDLGAGTDDIERQLGVRAAYGGKHTGRGTHNALISLGAGTYLEIIAPDLDQPPPQFPRPFGLDSLREPRLVTWAVRVSGIEHRAEIARSAGYDPGGVVEMTRRTPAGHELRWRLTLRLDLPGDGVVPFLIEWDADEHPSETAPGGAGLIDLEAEHPRPGHVAAMLEAIRVELPLTESARPALIATIEGPAGTVVLT
jgi:hypothetical protein